MKRNLVLGAVLAILLVPLLIGLVFSTRTALASPTPNGDTYLFLPLVAREDFENMARIPAGVFQMGCDPAHNGGFSCAGNNLPLHPINLDTYYIDLYEVTNVQYAECVTAGSCTAPASNTSKTRASYYQNPSFNNYPVLWVSWSQASEYCAWAGKRLPTEAEWEKAARGTTMRAFPWGDAITTCVLANSSGCVGDTTAVGSYPAGASPYGVFDMAGNAWEWVNDWYDAAYYQSTPPDNPPGPASGTERSVRGGSFDSISALLAAHRGKDVPGKTNSLIGFRCAKSP